MFEKLIGALAGSRCVAISGLGSPPSATKGEIGLQRHRSAFLGESFPVLLRGDNAELRYRGHIL